MPGLGARGFQRFDGFAAQGVELRGGHEARAVEVERHVDRLEQRFAQASQAFAQLGFGLAGVFGIFSGLNRGRVALPLWPSSSVMLSCRPSAVSLERDPGADAPLGRFFLQPAHPVHVAVAVDLHAFAQIFEAFHGVFGEDTPDVECALLPVASARLICKPTSSFCRLR